MTHYTIFRKIIEFKSYVGATISTSRYVLYSFYILFMYVLYTLFLVLPLLRTAHN